MNIGLISLEELALRVDNVRVFSPNWHLYKDEVFLGSSIKTG